MDIWRDEYINFRSPFLLKKNDITWNSAELSSALLPLEDLPHGSWKPHFSLNCGPLLTCLFWYKIMLFEESTKFCHIYLCHCGIYNFIFLVESNKSIFTKERRHLGILSVLFFFTHLGHFRMCLNLEDHHSEHTNFFLPFSKCTKFKKKMLGGLMTSSKKRAYQKNLIAQCYALRKKKTVGKNLSVSIHVKY